MIKKTILMLLVLVGGVMSANATDYIVSGNRAILNGNHDTDYWWEDSENQLTETTTSGIYTLVVSGCSLTENTDYGFKVKVSENKWDDNTTFPGSAYNINVPYTGTYTLIYYVDIANKDIRVIATPMLRWSLGNNGSGNWTWLYDSSAFFTKTDNNDFEWTYEVSSEDFTSDFSFRLYSAVFKKSAYPDSQDKVIAYGDDASTSAYFNTAESTDYSWKLIKPTYPFTKIRITAKYNPFANSDFGTWDVSAEAVTSVTLTPAKTYTTLTSSYNLDFTNTSLKAFIVTDEDVKDNKVTMTQVYKVPAGTGLVVKSENTGAVTVPLFDGTGADDVTGNKMEGSATEETEIAANAGYILKDGAFHPSNGEGNLAAGKAYLHIAVPTDPTGSAPALSMDFGEGTTSIQVVDRTEYENLYYTLDGRRVAQPTKGLYIVNGKKVIVK